MIRSTHMQARGAERFADIRQAWRTAVHVLTPFERTIMREIDGKPTEIKETIMKLRPAARRESLKAFARLHGWRKVAGRWERA